MLQQNVKHKSCYNGKAVCVCIEEHWAVGKVG